MILGFTGTRRGMTAAQQRTVARLIAQVAAHSETALVGLHGDCVGADVDFHLMCRRFGLEVICRPCNLTRFRAYTDARAVGPPVPPMARNAKIVADSSLMFACPPNREVIKRGSGTWGTIAIARRDKRPLAIIYPEGDTLEEPKLPAGTDFLGALMALSGGGAQREGDRVTIARRKA